MSDVRSRPRGAAHQAHSTSTASSGISTNKTSARARTGFQPQPCQSCQKGRANHAHRALGEVEDAVVV